MVRRQQSRRNLPFRINKVWGCFAEYVLDKDDGDDVDGDGDAEGSDEKTPEPEDVLDSMMSGDVDGGGGGVQKVSSKTAVDSVERDSVDILEIDHRLVADAKSKRESRSRSMPSDSHSASSSVESMDSFNPDADADDQRSDRGPN